ncbi:hypothetical protein [Nocardia sp. NPDC057440]|uniref:hypothetical protein n=1 Tax=Nocardia sp. NPDC057440 TaxID=3346134 RepID=UPI00366FE8F1
MSPQIPGMPTPPPTDPGQGAHGSQPIYSRADDVAFAHVALSAQLAADAIGLTHAADHLRHYLSNSGDDLKIDPDQIMNDDPKLKQHVDSFVTKTVQKIASDAANYNKSVSFQSDWYDYSFPEYGERDWFLAIGSVEASTSGVVTTTPPDTDGAQPRVTIDYQVHLFDRYNWDGTKETEIAGIKFTDARLGALHTAGLAKEFNMYGSSTTKHYEGVLPAYGSIDLPSGPDSRGGTRTDPTR